MKQKMIEVFGQENLVYAHPENLSKINLSQETSRFILDMGLPYVVDYFRFSMDFEAISKDIKIGESLQHLGQVFSVGCLNATPLVGRMIHLGEIGLLRNANLSDIGKRLRFLNINIEDDVILHSEVDNSSRICLDTENEGRIISISPKDLSITFLNSNFQKLSACLIACHIDIFAGKDFDQGINDFKSDLKKIDPKAFDSEIWVEIIERLVIDSKGY
ncbi:MULTISPECIES: SUKH-4 family immunity protein [Pseudanabaena]|uniref:Uncharacterized protein n=2 Tax=Pseudanabaena TaxID=1152 RepID=L8MWG3_9CYAN|nr:MULTISPECIES: SUKH-4 family immunity protein [Pseudanabaena]ELS30343.1 hypothetical protein Pse7429DRAFT_4587 [Pseudanabaena biceps PCC 7429]MDG3497379.1 SUKH-4 family immunity protein [Pseudanabaena catenata USMAC16]